MDLTASIARIGGARLPPDRPFDGIDILQLLEKQQPLLSRTLFWHARRGDRTWWAVRDASLKYVARQDGEQKEEYLFDLDRDAGEKNNLLARRREDTPRLQQLLAAWKKQVQSKRSFSMHDANDHVSHAGSRPGQMSCLDWDSSRPAVCPTP